jgi:hypothetical protein|tara:strand:+ start:282 stop:566 length:285 start_codon:yes stop_codon:yes gene_type:complete
MMTEDDQQKLTVMMIEISSKVQILLDKQDELADNINKIKEAVYNPDSGLYARLKDLDARIQSIESAGATNARILWIFGGTVAALLVQTAWSVLF